MEVVLKKLNTNEKMLTKIDKNLDLLKQHVETQNGRVKKNEKEIIEINKSLGPTGHIGKKLDWINSRVLLGLGGLSAIGFVSLILGAIITVLTILNMFSGV